ncbi:RNA polymerase sigma-70 factor (family 1) [Pedobacter africanus]|uniref:RNA polymerase sigma factor n=1 Tax=Pedobacter africanus TaxID=151894 RepID=UPI00286AD95A|nr:sigma-70 family RNA polymerase sigma factor [Pedobacter africanus]
MQIIISNQETFKVIFLKYHKSLCLFALKYLKSKEDAEEAVQSVFLKMLEVKVNFESQEVLRAYLYRSVYHTCLNSIRSKTRQINREDFYQSQIDPDEQPYLNNMLRAELTAILSRELTFLPKIQADIIKLSYFEELSNDEIAARLDLSLQTVKNYKHMGLKSIRKRFSRDSAFYTFITFLINFV